MTPDAPLFEEVTQVGIVVRDLKSALAEYTDRLGLGPWRIYRYAPPRLTEMRIRGEEISYSVDTAICWSGKVMWELSVRLFGHRRALENDHRDSRYSREDWTRPEPDWWYPAVS